MFKTISEKWFLLFYYFELAFLYCILQFIFEQYENKYISIVLFSWVLRYLIFVLELFNDRNMKMKIGQFPQNLIHFRNLLHLAMFVEDFAKNF